MLPSSLSAGDGDRHPSSSSSSSRPADQTEGWRGSQERDDRSRSSISSLDPYAGAVSCPSSSFGGALSFPGAGAPATTDHLFWSSRSPSVSSSSSRAHRRGPGSSPSRWSQSQQSQRSSSLFCEGEHRSDDGGGEDGDDGDGGDEYDEEVVAIIDNGSALTKVGLSCDDAPSKVFPTEVGVPRRRHRRKCDRDFYCGEEVRHNYHHLTRSFPVEGAVGFLGLFCWRGGFQGDDLAA